MAESNKFLVRPKVRFSKTSDVEESQDESKNADGKGVRSGGPKIKSIVTVKKPIRLVKVDRTSENEILDSGNIKARKKSVTEDKLPLTEIQVPNEHNGQRTANVQGRKSNGNVAIQLKSNSLGNVENTVGKVQHSEYNRNLDQPSKSQNNNKTHEDTAKNKIQKGKENRESGSKKKNICTPNVKEVKGLDRFIGKRKVPVSSGKLTQSFPQLQITKSKHFASASKHESVKTPTVSRMKNVSVRAKTTNVMPCLKYKDKTKKDTPIKKTVVRNIVGSKIKPYVGPGTLRTQHDTLRACDSEKTVHVKPDIISGEKLAQPEYNSITCTINKLNEVKKEKVVTDIEHLPAAYRNLITGKVTAALDFPLDEAIYKNLVDLSIDEKQLPSRLKRSKDPEPRQRDIVPKLSDFFKPEPTEEYCTPVCIKPRNPEIVENWDAFKISDKIFEWKYRMDHNQ